jgi:hypothetical protein
LGLQFKDETSKVVHLERRVLRFWILDTSEIRWEICGKFWNVVLENDGEDQLDRSRGNGVKDGRNIRKTIKRRKANWRGHILRRNCLPKRRVEGNIAR